MLDGSTLLQWLNTNPHWAGFITFLISAAESVAILGTIVPGSIMMAAIGTLVGAGIIPFWSIMVWAIVGAIVGDGISYWFGFYFKDRLHYMWPFKTYPQILDKGEYFFVSHGTKSVFIGRFVGPVRAIVPLVAGMFGMKPLRFILANVSSAIIWAPLYLLPGILLGAASQELPSDIATHAFIMLLLTIMLVSLFIWAIRKTLLLIHGQINNALNHLWLKLQQSRYLHIVTTLLKHHNPAKTHGQLVLAFYFLLIFILFIALFLTVLTVGSQNIFINKIFFYLFRSLRTPSADHAMIMVTLLGQSVVIIPAVIVVFLYTALKRQWHTALHILALLIIAPISIEVVKHLAHSPRPWGVLTIPKGFSFPSGHSVLSATFYFGLALLITHAKKIKRKWPLFTLVGVIVFFVGISRIYLGVHWFTDVLGGWLLSTLLLMLTALSFNRNKEKKPIEAGKLTLVFILSLMLIYSVDYFAYINKLRKNYSTVDWPIYTEPLNSWWNQKGKHLPLFRLNRLGAANDILNIQWVGDLDNIKQTLLQNGWQEPSERTWISTLYRITDVKSAEYLPLVSTLYLDKTSVLILVKHTADNPKKLVVLQFWNSNLILVPSSKPLWVGSVESSPRTYSWLFNTRRHKINALNSDLIFNQLPSGLIVKTQVITMKTKKRSQENSILLIKPILKEGHS